MALGGVPEDSVELDIPETLPMVAVDRGLLERAVANIVENAVKYSPAGRPVSVSASALANRVEVRVVDRGPGVPDEAKVRIFEPFQRHGDAPRGAGVGLGLAVARGFTEAIGGTLAAEDTPAAASPWSSPCPERGTVLRYHRRSRRPPLPDVEATDRNTRAVRPRYPHNGGPDGSCVVRRVTGTRSHRSVPPRRDPALFRRCSGHHPPAAPPVRRPAPSPHQSAHGERPRQHSLTGSFRVEVDL
ncbi:sensor histidine kinase [Streptomyces cirratus]